MFKKKEIKSWQVYDWLAKWLIMSGYMDLRRPRVYRRSNVGLVFICFEKNVFGIIYTYLRRRTLAGNEIVDHSDVVGASPAGAVTTTPSFST